MVETRRSSRLREKRKLEQDSASKEDSKDSEKVKAKPAVKKAKKDTTKLVIHENDGKDEKELQEGDELKKEIVLQDENGKDVDVTQTIKDNKLVLIFAYPKASTPGCTRQAKGYSENYSKLSKKAKIFGISSDSSSSQLKFLNKYDLKVDALLSDPEKVLISLLGAKKYPKGIIRSHWIFKDGKLCVKRVKVSPEVSIEDGLKEIEELSQD